MEMSEKTPLDFVLSPRMIGSGLRYLWYVFSRANDLRSWANEVLVVLGRARRKSRVMYLPGGPMPCNEG